MVRRVPGHSASPRIYQGLSACGSVFAFDGQIWHGTGVNIEGEPRRRLGALLLRGCDNKRIGVFRVSRGARPS